LLELTGGLAKPLAAKARLMARVSVASLAFVDVPWALI
jgi:hypothetical protein